MDPLKLLSRSTKFSRAPKDSRTLSTPSGGRAAQPQLFASKDVLKQDGLGKRKRGQDDRVSENGKEATLEFFDDNYGSDIRDGLRQAQDKQLDGIGTPLDRVEVGNHEPVGARTWLPLEERKRIFKQHRLKAMLLYGRPPKKSRKVTKNVSEKAQKARNALYPNPLQSLQDLAPRYGLSKRLSSNINDQGYATPTEVQIGALPLLLDNPQQYMSEVDDNSASAAHLSSQIDLLTVAPTGSGKTLAFMIPLLHSLLSKRQLETTRRRQTSAIILAPTKELASQITNEGRKLVRGTGLSISQMRKGMNLPSPAVEGGVEVDDDEEDRDTVVKTDIIVSTPGILQSIVAESRNPAWRVQHLVLDEADVLLDPLFKEQTLDIWNSLGEPDLRVSLWSATMGSNIEELARSTIRDRLERVSSANGAEFAEAPLIRLVVGLKDSAVPNVKHKLTYAATERGKLMGLRQLLHPVSSDNDSTSALRPPFLVFTQTIERAIALHSELLYDIPAEAGGISRIAVLHSDLSDAKRDSIMTRFRKGDVWVLITTDLLSRGVDFRGVNGVVNYDIPTSSAAYVHRIGRTGRAGRNGGVAVTLYSKEDIPYLKHVVNVVAMAEKQRGAESGVDQWLLDALPRLSKNQKQNIKKRGLEFRTARGQKKDPKAARRARISTKAGFIRKTENNRKGAILGNRRRQDTIFQSDAAEDTDFAGFD